MQLDYTVPTTRTFAEAVDAVQAAAGDHGFRVGYVHPLSEEFAKKGIEREPVTIVELCNANYASQVLAEDILIGLMLPCPVMVFEQDGDVLISTMRPSLLAQFYPEAEIADIAAEVEAKIFAIVEQAAGV